MNVEEVIERISDMNPQALLADGFDAALVGFTEGFKCVAVYDRDICLDVLIRRGPARDSERQLWPDEAAF